MGTGRVGADTQSRSTGAAGTSWLTLSDSGASVGPVSSIFSGTKTFKKIEFLRLDPWGDATTYRG